jgi:hypothetical protein
MFEITEQEEKRMTRGEKYNSDKIITNLTLMIYNKELEQNHNVMDYYIKKMDYFRESIYHV